MSLLSGSGIASIRLGGAPLRGQAFPVTSMQRSIGILRRALSSPLYLIKCRRNIFYLVMLLNSTKRHYIADNRPRKPQLDTRYGVCFRFLLAFLLTRLPVLLRRDDLSIAMVLEEGAPGSMDAYRIVQQLRKQPETQDIMNMFDGLSFGP